MNILSTPRNAPSRLRVTSSRFRTLVIIYALDASVPIRMTDKVGWTPIWARRCLRLAHTLSALAPLGTVCVLPTVGRHGDTSSVTTDIALGTVPIFVAFGLLVFTLAVPAYCTRVTGLFQATFDGLDAAPVRAALTGGTVGVAGRLSAQDFETVWT